MSREVTPILTAQDCIVAMMMAIAISDSNIRTAELVKIQLLLIIYLYSQSTI